MARQADPTPLSAVRRRNVYSFQIDHIGSFGDDVRFEDHFPVFEHHKYPSLFDPPCNPLEKSFTVLRHGIDPAFHKGYRGLGLRHFLEFFHRAGRMSRSHFWTGKGKLISKSSSSHTSRGWAAVSEILPKGFSVLTVRHYQVQRHLGSPCRVGKSFERIFRACLHERCMSDQCDPFERSFGVFITVECAAVERIFKPVVVDKARHYDGMNGSERIGSQELPGCCSFSAHMPSPWWGRQGEPAARGIFRF